MLRGFANPGSATSENVAREPIGIRSGSLLARQTWDYRGTVEFVIFTIPTIWGTQIVRT
jgi:hypothetical protein